MSVDSPVPSSRTHSLRVVVVEELALAGVERPAISAMSAAVSSGRRAAVNAGYCAARNFPSWLPLPSAGLSWRGAGRRFRHDSWLLSSVTVEVVSPEPQGVRDR